MDEELLELLEIEAATVRGDDDALVFTAGRRTVEVRVERRDDRRWLDGMVEPADASEVQLEHRASPPSGAAAGAAPTEGEPGRSAAGGAAGGALGGTARAPVDDVGHF